MVALPFDPQVARTTTFNATLTTSQSVESLPIRVTALGWRGLVCETAFSVEPGAHAWVDLELPTGKTIRPLVQLEPRVSGQATGRFVHLFPKDRHALEAYHASRTLTY